MKEITEKPQVVFTRRRKGQPDKEASPALQVLAPCAAHRLGETGGP